MAAQHDLQSVAEAHEAVRSLIRYFSSRKDEKGELTSISLGQHLYTLESSEKPSRKRKPKKAVTTPPTQ